MTHHIGVIQGRLSPRPPGKLQAFPWTSWQDEFPAAADLGFDFIEWNFEQPNATENPIWTDSGRQNIIQICERTGVAVRSVCADYFMVQQLAGGTELTRRANVRVLKKLIEFAAEVGARRILLPLLEQAGLSTPARREDAIKSLRSAAPVAAQCGVVLGLEMEISGPEYAGFIASVGHPAVRAYYDTGNSTAAGFDIERDIEPLLPVLEAVHIKDRVVGGTSRPVGTGATNFPGFFRKLRSAGFTSDFVLQHFFELDPRAEAGAALAFVRALLHGQEAA